jgi:uncharacterized protein
VPVAELSPEFVACAASCGYQAGMQTTSAEPKVLSLRGKNVLGTELAACCHSPKTGFYRDGFCRVADEDLGLHAVCAVMTEEFLEFSKARGNDLSTARLEFGFAGLKSGDKWCLCAARWKEALDAGKAPPVILEATHPRALEVVSLDQLKSCALQ